MYTIPKNLKDRHLIITKKKHALYMTTQFLFFLPFPPDAPLFTSALLRFSSSSARRRRSRA